MIGKFLRNAAVALVKPHIQFATSDSAVRVSALGCSVFVAHAWSKLTIGHSYEVDVETWNTPFPKAGQVWSRDVGGLAIRVTSVPLRRAEHAKQRTEQVSLN